MTVVLVRALLRSRGGDPVNASYYGISKGVPANKPLLVGYPFFPLSKHTLSCFLFAPISPSPSLFRQTISCISLAYYLTGLPCPNPSGSPCSPRAWQLRCSTEPVLFLSSARRSKSQTLSASHGSLQPSEAWSSPKIAGRCVGVRERYLLLSAPHIREHGFTCKIGGILW